MPHARKAAVVTLILGLGLSQSACLVGTVAGAAVGVTGAAVGATAKGVGMAAGALIPGRHDRDRR